MADGAALAGRIKSLGSLFGRFGLASLSSAIVSVSHLGVQLFSIHHLGTAAIGTLAFLLVATACPTRWFQRLIRSRSIKATRRTASRLTSSSR
jgi:hypothetical protein